MTNQDMPELMEKYEQLLRQLREAGSVAVAFSAGVDSTFLLHAAREALGEKALAITAVSGLLPERERNAAAEFCREKGIRHCCLTVDELSTEGFRDNPPNRCYLCKKALFTRILRLAAEQGAALVAEGSNVDDDGDYRPGKQAIRELGIASPLRDCGFSKAEIRKLSEAFGLPTWNKPSFACLASRIPYGDYITREKLQRIDRAEQRLLDLGFTQFRVRLHGDMARIELLPEEMDRLLQPELRTELLLYFRTLGFSYTALDLQGYRTGSLNEALPEAKKQIP